MPRFTDDFNRADGSLGSNWTNLTGSFTIVSNQIRCNASGAEACVRINSGSYANDQDAMLTRTVVGTTSYFGMFQGVACRCATSGHTCYFGYIDSQGNWYFGLFNAGVYTEISSGLSIGVTANDIFMIDAVGTTIRFRRDRGGTITTLGSGTNSTLTSGYPGIAGYDYQVYWSPQGYSDNFNGGDNVGTSVSLPPARSGPYRSLMTW